MAIFARNEVRLKQAGALGVDPVDREQDHRENRENEQAYK
jgi:hypothetical protein